MRIVFFLLITGLCLGFVTDANAWPPPTDSHPCYKPNNQFWWCNNTLPSQRFWRNLSDDLHTDVRVTFSGTTHSVKIRIYDLWYNAGGTWYRIADCNATSATPAAFWDTYVCAYDVGDPWYQNWDTCPGRKIKIMLYCWPVAGCIDVAPGLGTNPAPSWLTQYLDAYLDTEANMLRPSTSAPRLNPFEAPRHVYAIRTNGSSHVTCPC